MKAGYVLDVDEARGVLAGVLITTTAVDADLASVQPILIGYLGGYYYATTSRSSLAAAKCSRFGGNGPSSATALIVAGKPRPS